MRGLGAARRAASSSETAQSWSLRAKQTEARRTWAWARSSPSRPMPRASASGRRRRLQRESAGAPAREKAQEVVGLHVLRQPRVQAHRSARARAEELEVVVAGVEDHDIGPIREGLAGHGQRARRVEAVEARVE